MAHSEISDLASSVGSSGKRYKILDRRRNDLAVSFKMYSVYARPLEISDINACVEFLSGIIDCVRTY